MSDKSTIEWTDATWNPIRAEHGRHICARISPGCDNCYAATMTKRFTGVDYGQEGQPLAVPATLDASALELPLKWKQPRKIFVCSMTDLFGEWVSNEWLTDIFLVMAEARQHTFQVLTKRPKRMAEFIEWYYVGAPVPPNIWLGVTVESDAYAWRANILRTIPAAVRFISAEPLLSGLPSLHLDGIQWLISGGESGRGARPLHPDWVRDLRDRCQAADVAYFHKQWGEWRPVDGPKGPYQFIDGGHKSDIYIDRAGLTIPSDRYPSPYFEYKMRRLGTKAAGRLLDGRTWDEFPSPVAVAV